MLNYLIIMAQRFRVIHAFVYVYLINYLSICPHRLKNKSPHVHKYTNIHESPSPCISSIIPYISSYFVTSPSPRSQVQDLMFSSPLWNETYQVWSYIHLNIFLHYSMLNLLIYLPSLELHLSKHLSPLFLAKSLNLLSIEGKRVEPMTFWSSIDY